MNHHSDFFCQTFLQRTKMSGSSLFFFQGSDLFFAQVCEDFDISCCIGITYIQELVKFIRRSVTTVQPYVTRFSLTELTTVGFRDQRTGKGKCFTTRFTADQFRSGSDVTPLVGTTHLQAATFVLIQEQKVVPLQ